jgi:hypothetical protein
MDPITVLEVVVRAVKLASAIFEGRKKQAGDKLLNLLLRLYLALGDVLSAAADVEWSLKRIAEHGAVHGTHGRDKIRELCADVKAAVSKERACLSHADCLVSMLPAEALDVLAYGADDTTQEPWQYWWETLVSAGLHPQLTAVERLEDSFGPAEPEVQEPGAGVRLPTLKIPLDTAPETGDARTLVLNLNERDYAARLSPALAAMAGRASLASLKAARAAIKETLREYWDKDEILAALDAVRR